MKKKRSCQLRDLATLSINELKAEHMKARRGIRFLSIMTILTFLAGMINVYFDEAMFSMIGVAICFIPMIDENRTRLLKINKEMKFRSSFKI